MGQHCLSARAGVPGWSLRLGAQEARMESVISDEFKQQGATTMNDPFAGFHVKDPDGVNIQVVQA